jgi:hypothetical protein
MNPMPISSIHCHQGEPTSEGFVVLKGSIAASTTVNSIQPFIVNFRQSLIDKGVLQLNGENYEFSEDYIFSSPSTAAAIVMERNANGLLEWKLKDGKSLKEIETNYKNNGA